jgi:hypothetical protein
MIEANVLAAVITSVTSAGATAGVAITALVLNNKRFDLIERRLDKIETKLESIDTRLNEITVDIAKLKMGFHE